MRPRRVHRFDADRDSDETWAQRIAKRVECVRCIHRSEEYQRCLGIVAAHGPVQDYVARIVVAMTLEPNPYERTPKRQWESDVCVWRAQLRFLASMQPIPAEGLPSLGEDGSAAEAAARAGPTEEEGAAPDQSPGEAGSAAGAAARAGPTAEEGAAPYQSPGVAGSAAETAARVGPAAEEGATTYQT